MRLNFPKLGKLKIELGRNNEKKILLFTHGLLQFFTKTDYRGRKFYITNDCFSGKEVVLEIRK